MNDLQRIKPIFSEALDKSGADLESYLTEACGQDADLQEKVKVGDKILYGKYVGDEVELKGKEYLIIQRADILAIVVD